MVSVIAGAIFLCGSMELHRSHAAKPLLVSFGVIEMNVILNSGYQLLLISKFSQIVHFRFQNSPESLHRTIVNASTNSGHALYHFCSIQLCSEGFARVLESTVTMKQRMCVGIFIYCFFKGIEYQFIIVAGTNFIGISSAII